MCAKSAKRNIAQRSLLIGSALRAKRRQQLSTSVPTSPIIVFASAFGRRRSPEIHWWSVAASASAAAGCVECLLITLCVACWQRGFSCCLPATTMMTTHRYSFFPFALLPSHALQITDNGSAKNTRIWIILTPTHSSTYIQRLIPNPAMACLTHLT